MMKRLFTFLLTLMLCLSFTGVGSARAGELVLAAGAGYKKMVNKLVDAYEARSGMKVDRIYGNMGRVTTQAMRGGAVDLVLGAKAYLGKSGLDITGAHELGRGRLVVAWSKGHSYSAPADLLAANVKRIAVPDMKLAIYGRAAREFLKNAHLTDKVGPKLIEVATVPQVFSYLNANEVDMGFMNLTHAMNVKDRISGYTIVDDNLYNPISIVVVSAPEPPHAAAIREFTSFLETAEAKDIVKAHGL